MALSNIWEKGDKDTGIQLSSLMAQETFSFKSPMTHTRPQKPGLDTMANFICPMTRSIKKENNSSFFSDYTREKIYLGVVTWHLLDAGPMYVNVNWSSPAEVVEWWVTSADDGAFGRFAKSEFRICIVFHCTSFVTPFYWVSLHERLPHLWIFTCCTCF